MSKGTLIALGGGYDDDLIKLIRSEICPINSSIEIIATAATEPQESGVAYKKAFEELGCGRVQFMLIDEEHEADKPEYLARIRQADVIFFTGGDQVRLTEFLRGTQLLGIMCKGEMKTTQGFGFIKGIYMDTHFAERGRFGRLAHAVAHDPHYVGIGLSEETGIIIKEGNKVEVFGTGVVTIIDASKIRFSNTRQVSENEPIAVENLIMHMLVEGYRYCLKEHLFQPVERAPQQQAEASDTASVA